MKCVGLSAMSALLALLAVGCASTPDASPIAPAAEPPNRMRIVARLDQSPGNITVTPQGRIIVSLHQHFAPDLAVARIVGGRHLEPFPNDAWNRRTGPASRRLDSVLGVQCDTEGVVWMLDNGMRTDVTPKLVGWDLEKDALYKVIELPEPISRPDSFLNDLAVDRDRDHIYIADPAGGDNAALIVVHIPTGSARRVLEGHETVIPEPIDLVINQRAVEIRKPDGTTIRPRVGVNPIALDRENRWLYFGPMHGTAMYRIRTADLTNAKMSPVLVGRRVERFGNKPISDGSSVTNDGEVYISDIGNNAIGMINRNGSYIQLFQSDEVLAWPDAFSFGPDDWCYVVINQLHRGPVLNAGKDGTTPPFLIARFRREVGGVTGR